MQKKYIVYKILNHWLNILENYNLFERVWEFTSRKEAEKRIEYELRYDEDEKEFTIQTVYIHHYDL